MITTIRKVCDQVHDALALAEVPPRTTGAGTGKAGSRPPMPAHILDAKRDLKNQLTSWALLISDEAECVIDCDDDSLSIAAWIYQKADWLAAHELAPDFVDEISTTLRRITDAYIRRDERIFCGIHAGQRIWAKPGQSTVTLPDGTVEQVKTLRAEMAARYLDHRGRAGDVAAIIRIFFGIDITGQWITATAANDRKRGRADPLTPTTDGTYVVRDVLDRLSRRRGQRARLVVA